MAALNLTVGVAGITTGTIAITLLQLRAAANQRVRVKRVCLGFRGTSNTDPVVRLEILRQSSNGTMTAATPVLHDNLGAETIQTTAGHTASAEPTAGDVIYRLNIHPQTGAEIIFAPGEEPIILGGGKLGFRVTTPTTQTADIQVDFEE